MQITQVVVGNVLYPLTEGQPLPIDVGQTLRVFYQFKYKLPKTSGVRIWASLHYYTLLGVYDREDKAQTKGTITLEKATEWTDFSGEIDILIGQAPAGVYGLTCELPDYGAEARHRINDCLEIIAAPGIFEMIGPLLVIGLMAGIVLPAMKEGF